MSTTSQPTDGLKLVEATQGFIRNKQGATITPMYVECYKCGRKIHSNALQCVYCGSHQK